MALVKVIDHVWWEAKPHFQLAQDTDSFWVMYLITEGRLDYQIGTVSGRGQGPCVLLCPPGVLFQRRVLAPLTFHFFRLDITSSLHPPVGPLTVDAERMAMDEQLLRQYVYDLSGPSFVIRSHLVADLFLYQPPQLIQQSDDPLFKQPIRHPQILRLIRYLETHYQEEISISQLSQQLNFNAAYLSRLFKSETGVSPKHYLLQLRLKNVQQLLVSTTLPIEEIAELTGFKYGYHLSKYFKQQFAISPSEFRKKHRV
ncbi:MAG TPA: helix-turn-helix domain-containing protein [Candidatus Enterococcus stercoravium]|nr:helix-turn-helix domain-containing protein [Candidatus Enterococcus stercoravium]